MNPSESNEESSKKHGSYLERASWFLILFGMLTQLNFQYSFPSYNCVLGFWGAYSSFTKHGRATFGFIVFTFLALILDIIYCSINSFDSDAFRFSLSMLILSMFVKVYALVHACQFFAAIGGAYSMDSSIIGNSGVYDNTMEYSSEAVGAGFYSSNISEQQYEDEGNYSSTVGRSDSNNRDSGTF